MRSRFSDGVVIVLLGLAVFTAVVHALPAPPEMQASVTGHQSVAAPAGGKVGIAPRRQAAAP